MKKIFFFDIDGTLLPLGKDKATAKTKYAISELQKQGHEVFIATGKSIEHAGWLGVDLGINNFVATNGQVLVKDNELIFEEGFTIDDVKFWTEKAQLNDMILGYQGAYTSGLLNGNKKLISEANRFFDDVTIKHPQLIDTYPTDYTVGQMWFVGDVKAIDFDKSKYRVVSWPHTGYDVLPVGASKARGIKKYLETLNEPVETYAFGDGHNDVEMFDFVDHAIAMDNASDIVKKHADEITKSADADGIYHYLVEKGLIGADNE